MCTYTNDVFLGDDGDGSAAAADIWLNAMPDIQISRYIRSMAIVGKWRMVRVFPCPPAHNAMKSDTSLTPPLPPMRLSCNVRNVSFEKKAIV